MVVQSSKIIPEVEVQKVQLLQTPLNRFHTLVLEDQRLRADGISGIIGISHERVHHSLTQERGMKKIRARRMPQLLSNNQKAIRDVFYRFFQHLETGIDLLHKRLDKCVDIDPT